jgi:hypothetical protein
MSSAVNGDRLMFLLSQGQDCLPQARCCYVVDELQRWDSPPQLFLIL